MFPILVILCLIWGFNFVVMKTANNFFTPEIFVTYRYTSAAIVLLAVAFLTKLPKPPRKFWLWIFFAGLGQIVICGLAIQICFQYLNAGLVSVLNYTMPIWVTLMAGFFLQEKLTRKKIFGVLLSVIGVGVLMNVDVSGNFLAMFLVIVGAIAWAASNVIIKAKLSECNPVVLTTWQIVSSAVVLLIYSALFVEGNVTWTPMAVACLAYNGILASALAFFLWCYALANMEASKASIAVLGVPVVSVISSVFCLDEPLTLSMAIGIFMVLTGIVIVQHS